MQEESPVLKIGQKLALNNGQHITVVTRIGEGGQGAVYEVTVDETGETKALKYQQPRINYPEETQANYRNILNLSGRECPHSSFLWPQAVTVRTDADVQNNNPFGYIMNLIPADYVSFAQLFGEDIEKPQIDVDFSVSINAAINLTSSFRKLHNLGFLYKDLNHNNFALHPATGDVLIFDTDNIAGPGMHENGMVGFPGYMAPEVARQYYNGERVGLSIKTDLYSLSVILFRLFGFQHPLLGKDILQIIRGVDKVKLLQVYGTKPVFVFDDNNSNNRFPEYEPMWHIMPDFIKKIFRTAFSQNSLLHAEDRVLEKQWLKALQRFKSFTYKCNKCKASIFFNEDGSSICTQCGNKINPGACLHFFQEDSSESYMTLPVLDGINIFRALPLDELDSCDILGKIEWHPERGERGIFYLRNLSDDEWNYISARGNMHIVPVHKACPIENGSEIYFRPGDGKHKRNASYARVIINNAI